MIKSSCNRVKFLLHKSAGAIVTFSLVQIKLSATETQACAARRTSPANIMSKTTRYLLVSLPTSISPSNDHEEALTALRSAVSTDHGTVYPFTVPEFKIGTLDALVQQADELARLEGVCEGVVGKVGDSLRTILEGDEDKILQQKTVNDSQSTPRGMTA